MDKVTLYGAVSRFLFWKNVSLTAQVLNTDYNSNIRVFDRSVLRFTGGFVIGVLAP